MRREIPKAQYEGVLQLGETSLEVAVLDNDVRVIKQTDVFRALGRPARGNARGEIDEIKIPPFMDAKNLQVYINEEIKVLIKRVEYEDINGKQQQGYDCQLLPMVCELYLQARTDRLLTKNQEDTAQKAELLVRSLARVGIIALVDEATGYQYKREKDELQRILKAYISEELLPWQKRFPDIFYRELFRLNRWDFTVKGIKQRPGVIGKWTNKLIYEQLPDGVLQVLKSKTPKSSKGNKTARYHQSLTLDTGNPHLEAQIQQIITIFQIPDTMDEMWSHFEKLLDRKAGQLQLPFVNDRGRN